MKVTYYSKNNRLKLELDANTQKEAFKQLAEVQEIFDEEKCGLCGSDNISFQVRTIDGNDFYELKCPDCLAKLEFGQYKTGDKLFPKRRKKDGSYDREHHGWYKWQPESQ